MMDREQILIDFQIVIVNFLKCDLNFHQEAGNMVQIYNLSVCLFVFKALFVCLFVCVMLWNSPSSVLFSSPLNPARAGNNYLGQLYTFECPQTF